MEHHVLHVFLEGPAQRAERAHQPQGAGVAGATPGLVDEQQHVGARLHEVRQPGLHVRQRLGALRCAGGDGGRAHHHHRPAQAVAAVEEQKALGALLRHRRRGALGRSRGARRCRRAHSPVRDHLLAQRGRRAHRLPGLVDDDVLLVDAAVARADAVHQVQRARGERLLAERRVRPQVRRHFRLNFRLHLRHLPRHARLLRLRLRCIRLGRPRRRRLCLGRRPGGLRLFRCPGGLSLRVTSCLCLGLGTPLLRLFLRRHPGSFLRLSC
mmetsp:Transcript_16156/g.40541  ORF Transcript_16156/g.40541 Transcript_16156/m.40541 type:complete len:268 (+) Transcript_16156:302-1105(+)